MHKNNDVRIYTVSTHIVIAALLEAARLTFKYSEDIIALTIYDNVDSHVHITLGGNCDYTTHYYNYKLYHNYLHQIAVKHNISLVVNSKVEVEPMDSAGIHVEGYVRMGVITCINGNVGLHMY